MRQMTLPKVFSNCLTFVANSAASCSTCTHSKLTARNTAKRQGLQAMQEGLENSRLIGFATVLIGNLLGIACLLVVWNANAVTNKNVTWAVLIVGVASGMSILCCALCLLICFGGGRMGVVQRICCCCFSDRQKLAKYGQTAIPPMFSSLEGLKASKREAAKVYGIQTVCPTPEFQYFGNATPVMTTIRTTRLPTTTDSLSESTKSQLSAFSLISTAPASSPPLPTARLNAASELNRQNSNLYFPSTGAYASSRLGPYSPIVQFPPPMYGLLEPSSSPSSLAAISSEMALIRTSQQIKNERMDTIPYMSMYSGV